MHLYKRYIINIKFLKLYFLVYYINICFVHIINILFKHFYILKENKCYSPICNKFLYCQTKKNY